MIYKVGFHADVPRKKIGQKLFGKHRLSMEQFDHHALFDANNRALLIGASRGHTDRLPRQTALAEETGLRQNGNYCFFAALRYDCELHLTALDVEDRIRNIPLIKDALFGQANLSSLSVGEFQEQVRVEGVSSFWWCAPVEIQFRSRR